MQSATTNKLIGQTVPGRNHCASPGPIKTFLFLLSDQSHFVQIIHKAKYFCSCAVGLFVNMSAPNSKPLCECSSEPHDAVCACLTCKAYLCDRLRDWHGKQLQDHVLISAEKYLNFLSEDEQGLPIQVCSQHIKHITHTNSAYNRLYCADCIRSLPAMVPIAKVRRDYCLVFPALLPLIRQSVIPFVRIH